jgi:GNAT superfamily N-acetyltransferase
VIRRARQSDAKALSDFAARLFRSTYGNDTAASDLESYIAQNFSAERQAVEIIDTSAAVIVATADERFIGYAHLIIDRPDQRSAFLNRIYVDTEWRGSGLAKHLLEAVIGDLKRRGVTRLTLSVFERNAQAMAFCEKAGFATAGTTTFTIGQDAQADIVMEMDLVNRYRRTS